MSKNLSGRSYNVYVGTTAPTTASDKDDANYTLVGKVLTTNLNRSRGTIETSSKDDGDASAFIGGRRNQTVAFSARFDHTDDAGFALLGTAYDSASGTAYFLLSTGVSGDLVFSGSGVVTDLSKTFDDESASEFTCTIQANGDVTEATLA